MLLPPISGFCTSLAQHYSQLGLHDRAPCRSSSSALTHTPTLPDLCMTRARILKRAGDLAGAEAAMNDALDPWMVKIGF